MSVLPLKIKFKSCGVTERFQINMFQSEFSIKKTLLSVVLSNYPNYKKIGLLEMARLNNISFVTSSTKEKPKIHEKCLEKKHI